MLLSSLCLLWKFVAPRQSLLMWLNLQRIRCTSSLNSEWIHTDWYGALWLSVCTCNGDQGKLLVLLQLLHQMKWKGNRQKFCRLLKDASPDHMVGSLDTLTMETFSNFVSLWVLWDYPTCARTPVCTEFQHSDRWSFFFFNYLSVQFAQWMIQSNQNSCKCVYRLFWSSTRVSLWSL